MVSGKEMRNQIILSPSSSAHFAPQRLVHGAERIRKVSQVVEEIDHPSYTQDGPKHGSEQARYICCTIYSILSIHRLPTSKIQSTRSRRNSAHQRRSRNDTSYSLKYIRFMSTLQSLEMIYFS